MAYAPIFKGASGGLSDDLFSGIQDSFQDAVNIEIINNSKGISLSKTMIKDSLTTVDQLITSYLKVSNGDILAFGNYGGIYRKTGGIWYKNSNSLPSKILSSAEFDGYIYVTTITNLYRIDIGSISNSMLFTNWQTLQSANYHPLLTFFGSFLIIGDKNQLNKIELSSVYTTGDLTINPNYNIKFLSTVGDSIKVITDNGIDTDIVLGYVENGEKDTSPIKGIIIDSYIEKGGVPYILYQGNLGVLDGYRVVNIKKISDYSTNFGSIISNSNRIYFGGNGVVYEYGSLNKNYPEVINRKYKVSGGDNSIIGAIFIDGNDIYASWNNGGNYGIDKLSSNYNSLGYLTTRAYYGEFRVIEKTAELVKYAFNKISSGDSINIYYRLNGEGNFILHDTLTSTSVKNSNFITFKQLTGNFNFIEFKIELLSGNGTTTPELYELFLQYNIEQ